MMDGKVPRGFRNNNPFNIRKTGIAWQGEVPGEDTAFEAFDSPEMGVRAGLRNMSTHQKKYGAKSLSQLLGRHAPPNENDTGAYIQAVSQNTGLSPDAEVDLNDPEVAFKLASAVIRHENGGDLPENVVRSGVNQFMGGETAVAKAPDPNWRPKTAVPVAKAPEQPEGGGLMGYANSVLQSIVDFPPNALGTVLGLPGSAANLGLSALGVEEPPFTGVGDMSAMFRHNQDLALAAARHPFSPISEASDNVDEVRYQPEGLGEDFAYGAGSMLAPVAGQVALAQKAAPVLSGAMTMGQKVLSGLDDAFINMYRKNPVAAGAFEATSGGGAAAGASGAPDIPVPLSGGQDLGDFMGEGNAALLGGIGGSFLAPLAGKAALTGIKSPIGDLTLVPGAQQLDMLTAQGVNALSRKAGFDYRAPATGFGPAALDKINTLRGGVPGDEGITNLGQTTASQRELGALFNENPEQVAQSFEAIQNLDDMARALGAIGPEDIGAQPTVGQILNDPTFLSEESRALRSVDRGRQPLAQAKANEKFIEKTGQAIGQKYNDPKANAASYGKEVQAKFAPQVEAEKARIEAPALKAEDTLAGALEQDVGPTMGAQEVGKVSREQVLEPSYQKSKQEVRDAYAPFDENADIQGGIPNFQKVLVQQANKVDESVTPALVEKSAKEAKQTLNTLNKRAAKEEGVEEGPVMDSPVEAKPVTASIGRMEEGLSHIKTALRAARRSTEPGVDPKNYAEQIEGLSTDLENAIEQNIKSAELSGDSGLADSLKNARALRREHAVLYEGKNPIASVLDTKDSYGHYTVADKQVLPMLLKGNRDDVADYLRILDRPEFGSQKEMTKQGLADLYKKQVINANSGKVNISAHQKFMGEYGQAGESLWGSKGWAAMKKIGELQKQSDALAKARDVSLKRFNDKLKTRLSGRAEANNIMPEDVYDKLLSGKPGDRAGILSAYKEITVKAHPDLWKKFQSLHKDDLLKRLRGENQSIKNVSGEHNVPLSEGKIDELLGDSRAVEELNQVYGPDMAPALRKLSEGIKVFRRNHVTQKEEGRAEGFNRLANFARVFTGVLTRKGRALTAVKEELKLAAERSQARMLEDPKLIRRVGELLKQRDISESKLNMRLLSQLGAVEFLDKTSENEEKDKGK